MLISVPLQGFQPLKGHSSHLLTIAKQPRPHGASMTPARYKTGEWQNSELFLFLSKGLFHDNSVMVVDIALQITPKSCVYSLAAHFR